MSLFPAYGAETTKTPTPTQDTNWLQNPSFQIDVTRTQPKRDEQETVADTHKKRKHGKKHKRSKKKIKTAPPTPPPETDSSFLIDTTRTKQFLTVNTIHRPSAPIYKVRYYHRSNAGWPYKRRKFRRYYKYRNTSHDDKSADDNDPVITKDNLNSLEGSKVDDNFTGFKQEADLSQMTGTFNKKLLDDPNDIKKWLEYVKFQDTVYQFEKTYRKGSIAKGLRVLAERKLSILDKALHHNPNNDDLLRERLNVAISIYPDDELQVQLRKLVDKESGNIILWQGYIEATQCSMSHCNTPSVIKLYSKCLLTLHKLRRIATKDNKAQLEQSILTMLYQCGLFLKQSGLNEQLWTILRMYLELNLSPPDKNKFNITSGFNEKELVELEEIVFKSELPLHELWLRTEKLRESCHWLPFDSDTGCEDPQRLVFPEDVAELIHPITMGENTFKLIATILTLIKVPLLPCRHTTMQELGLDYIPWSLDSIESFLPIFLPMYSLSFDNRHLQFDNRMTVGPQYLNVLPGQVEYLNFILATMKNCIDCMSSEVDRSATCVWWLRFQRLLIILDREKRFKLPPNYSKRIKGNIKGLLKEESNRNNVIYYAEYALVEWELGNRDGAVNVVKTALSMNSEDGSKCHLKRILVEMYLNKDDEASNKEALGLLISLVGDPTTAELKFKHETLTLLTNPQRPTAVSHFLPDLTTDWVICNAWYLYLTRGPIKCGTFLEETLEKLDGFHGETIHEFYVAMLYKHCASNPGGGIFKLLDDILLRSVEKFPNNLFVLGVLAQVQSITSNCGSPWWRLKSTLIKSGRAFATLFAVVIVNQQIVEAQNVLVETFTGRKYEISHSYKNRMLSLFRRITRSDMCTRRCGLVWRLYLQFVHAHFESSVCRNVYYSAVEECPWLKALYIDAAIYIPTELPQIQDLIIEKQLRLHVTPEELDVLRS